MWLSSQIGDFADSAAIGQPYYHQLVAAAHELLSVTTFDLILIIQHNIFGINTV